MSNMFVRFMLLACLLALFSFFPSGRQRVLYNRLSYIFEKSRVVRLTTESQKFVKIWPSVEIPCFARTKSQKNWLDSSFFIQIWKSYFQRLSRKPDCEIKKKKFFSSLRSYNKPDVRRLIKFSSCILMILHLRRLLIL